MPNKTGNEVKCSYCGKVWKCRSKSMWISCPNCLQKTRNVKVNKEKDVNIDMDKKTKIRFVYQKKVLREKSVCGVDKGEIYNIREELSKTHNVPFSEIRVEFE